MKKKLLRRQMFRYYVAVASLLAFLYGCALPKDNDDDYYAEYSEQVDKTNKLLKQNQASDTELEKTAALFNGLDDIAFRQRAAVRKLRVLINTSSSASDLKAGRQDLAAVTEEAHAKILEIEIQLSITNKYRLQENFGTTKKAEWVQSEKRRVEQLAALYDSLEGFRLLFVEVDQILDDNVNEKLAALNEAKLPAPKPSEPIKVPANLKNTVSAAPATSVVLTGQASGTVYAPNGQDPVAGAIVYAPEMGNENLGGVAIKPSGKDDEPSENYLVKTKSSAKGVFTLSGLPQGKVLIKVKKGAFEQSSLVSIAADKVTTLQQKETTLPSVNSSTGKRANIAVIEGSYDHLENVLTKLGLTENEGGFKMFASIKELVSSPDKLKSFDLVMVNCGNGTSEGILNNQNDRDTLIDYVKGGGRLYVTDQSYDFVEQLFPDGVRFAGDKTDTKAGPMNAAQIGQGMSSTAGTINSVQLESWLGSVKCGTKSAPQNCLSADGSVLLQGFSGQWATIEAAGTGTTTWVTRGGGNPHPLTVSFNRGKGKVFYSSYHTFHGGKNDTLYAQERILQYFIFEVIQ